MEQDAVEEGGLLAAMGHVPVYFQRRAILLEFMHSLLKQAIQSTAIVNSASAPISLV